MQATSCMDENGSNDPVLRPRYLIRGVRVLVGGSYRIPYFGISCQLYRLELCSICGAIATKDFTDLDAYASGQASGLLYFGSLLLKGLKPGKDDHHPT